MAIEASPLSVSDVYGCRKFVHHQPTTRYQSGSCHERLQFPFRAATLGSSQYGIQKLPRQVYTQKVHRAREQQLIRAEGRSNAADAFSWKLSSSPKASAPKSVRAVHTWAVPASTTDIDRSSLGFSLQYPLVDMGEKSSLVETLPSIPKVSEEVEQMKEWIEMIREMFRSMNDGEISVSAYDTAWVALVPALDGSARPQFPKSLQWIVENQLSDGSWGDNELFLAHDRVCNTLGCIVALKTWNTGPANVERGLEFLQSNMAKMETEEDDHMPIGFEIVFPAMLENAKDLGLDLPYESPMVKRIRKEREKKLERIPMELVHKYPTTLLHSLEGLHKLVDWGKLIKLQAKNGSFLFSPASTACALMHTGNLKCLEYLNSVLQKFDNAVPNVYPVDLFEHMWMVDRITRLGLSRYFKKEIRNSLDYVYSYWTDNGISWARESAVVDADDTAMGFRLLRLNGYDVSSDVFSHFKKNNEFFCFAGQTSQAVTGMYNLYRASQAMFPGERILEEAKSFTRKFLEEKHEKNEIHDKWILAKDLPGEVEYALKFPWCASLQRLETRQYLDLYGVDDVWIGKTLYRMPFVNNQAFLNLAKADFNLCQSIQKRELEQTIRWVQESEFEKLNFDSLKATQTYFSAAATMFEPEMAPARLVWTRCFVLATLLDDFLENGGSTEELQKLLGAVERWDSTIIEGCSKLTRILYMGLSNTIDSISQEAFIAQGWDVNRHLRNLWARWISSILKEAKWVISGDMPSLKEYIEKGPSIPLEPVVLSSLFFVGPKVPDEAITNQDYNNIMRMVRTSGRILKDIKDVKESRQGRCSSVVLYQRENPGATEEEAIAHLEQLVEEAMKELVREVVRPSGVPEDCKQLHFNAVKIMNVFYRNGDGFSDSTSDMARRMQSVLFDPVS